MTSLPQTFAQTALPPQDTLQLDAHLPLKRSPVPVTPLGVARWHCSLLLGVLLACKDSGTLAPRGSGRAMMTPATGPVSVLGCKFLEFCLVWPRHQGLPAQWCAGKFNSQLWGKGPAGQLHTEARGDAQLARWMNRG